MEPILKWQYDQIVKELLLLQTHQADKSCPCETGGEMCVRKHLFTVEAYAQETATIESEEKWREKLMTLAAEAQAHRGQEEAALIGQGQSEDLAQWTRDWRKEFEERSLPDETQTGDAGSDASSCEATNLPWDKSQAA